MENKILKAVPKEMEIVAPVSGSMNRDQINRALVNLGKFSAIPALAFLGGLQSGLSFTQAFSLSLVPALINSLIDVITKWNDATPYLREK